MPEGQSKQWKAIPDSSPENSLRCLASIVVLANLRARRGGRLRIGIRAGPCLAFATLQVLAKLCG
jgi:hypothetical protein